MVHARFGMLIIAELVEPVGDVIGTAIAEIQIIGMFPHIEPEQRMAFAGGERVRAVRGFGDGQFAIGFDEQRGPARAELGGGGGFERLLELGHTAEILGQFGFELAGDFAAIGR